jgi:integrase
MRVPFDLADRVGLVEVKRSLGMGRLADARLFGPLITANLTRAFAMIRTEQPDRSRCNAIINRCFDVLLSEADRIFIPRTAEVDHELAAQEVMSDDRLTELEHQIASRKLTDALRFSAERRLQQLGLDSPKLAPAELDLVTLGLLRAQAEQERLIQFRLREPLLPYSPTDPLALSDTPFTSRHYVGARHGEPIGPTVGDAVATYLSAKRASWRAKTYGTNSQKLSFLVQHLGGPTPITSVTPGDVRTYRDQVKTLRLNHRCGAGTSFVERQTASEEHRIKPKTAAAIYEAAKSFFRWARSEGYIDVNPAQDIALALPKTQKGKKPRRPFTAEELEKLFQSPSFIGFKSGRRRFDPGKLQVRDARWWVPVLGYYTGARLGELVQLHVSDLHLEGPIPYIAIREEDGGEIGSGTEKHVKSHAGVRDVPLHPDVMTLGFRDFVATRRKHHKAKPRLFWEIAFGSDGQASSLFSKWFGRLLDKCGLPDRSLVFHSFRHGMEDAFRDRLTPQYVTDQVIGHEDGKTSSDYGQGVSLEVAYEAVRNLPLKLPIRELTHPSE